MAYCVSPRATQLVLPGHGYHVELDDGSNSSRAQEERTCMAEPIGIVESMGMPRSLSVLDGGSSAILFNESSGHDLN